MIISKKRIISTLMIAVFLMSGCTGLWETNRATCEKRLVANMDAFDCEKIAARLNDQETGRLYYWCGK